jgi:putative hemolysin
MDGKGGIINRRRRQMQEAASCSDPSHRIASEHALCRQNPSHRTGSALIVGRTRSDAI